MPSPSVLYKECNEAILAHTFNIFFAASPIPTRLPLHFYIYYFSFPRFYGESGFSGVVGVSGRGGLECPGYLEGSHQKEKLRGISTASLGMAGFSWRKRLAMP